MPSPPLTNREYAYFFVRGLGPSQDVTKLLELNPSEAWNAGDPGPRGARKSMVWKLESGLDDTADLDEHIKVLLTTLESRSRQLQTLWREYDLTLQCVGYYPASGHGVHLDREVVRRAANLGLALDLDFYYVEDPHE